MRNAGVVSESIQRIYRRSERLQDSIYAVGMWARVLEPWMLLAYEFVEVRYSCIRSAGDADFLAKRSQVPVKGRVHPIYTAGSACCPQESFCIVYGTYNDVVGYRWSGTDETAARFQSTDEAIDC